MTQPPTPDTEPSYRQSLVRDPLSADTRKTRLYVLAVSLIGVAMVQTGLVPTKIATFGIELEQPNRQALLLLIALVNIYFLIAFVIYAASDYRSWRAVVDSTRKRALEAHIFDAVGHRYNISGEALKRRYDEGSLDDHQRFGSAKEELSDQLGKLEARRSFPWLTAIFVLVLRQPTSSPLEGADLEVNFTDRLIAFLMVFFQSYYRS
jgi:hypothetical protein